MSDNLDFMAIFGGEGSLDLGSGGEDFDALFAEKEVPQPPKEKVTETIETAQPDKAPAETPEPEEKKEDANVPKEKEPEAPPQPAAAPEKKPAAPKAAAKPSAAPANPFEAAMRQVEEKITEDLFLNSPYLSVLGENGQTGRDEKRFLVNGLCHLMQGGLLVYIIPYYRLTADIARILCDNFERLSMYKFCGKEFQRFRQVAVLGIRKPRGNGSREVPGLLRQVQDDEKSRTTQRVSSSRYAYLIIIFAKTINNFFIPAMWTTDICIGVITIFPRSC